MSTMDEKCKTICDTNCLKTYIMRVRHKKKQEMETSISLQRQKREEEMKRFRVRMTLDEINVELQKLETKLSELKQQKHLLFSQLKKVLNEDDIRRRHRDLQWNANSALFAAVAASEAPPPPMPSTTNPNALFGPQMAFNSGNGANSSLQFFPNAATSGQNLRPQNAYPKFGPHLVPKGPPVTTTGVRTMKRTHETMAAVVPQRTSPPTTQSSHNYKSACVTYTPTLSSEYAFGRTREKMSEGHVEYSGGGYGSGYSVMSSLNALANRTQSYNSKNY